MGFLEEWLLKQPSAEQEQILQERMREFAETQKGNLSAMLQDALSKASVSFPAGARAKDDIEQRTQKTTPPEQVADRQMMQSLFPGEDGGQTPAADCQAKACFAPVVVGALAATGPGASDCSE